MDGRRFDAITVLLTRHHSRRATVKMVAGSIGSGIIAVLPTRVLARPKTKTLVCRAKENPINPEIAKFDCVIECPADTDSCFLCTRDEPLTVSCSGICCTAGVDCPGDPDEGASFNANTKKEAKEECVKAAVKGVARKAR